MEEVDPTDKDCKFMVGDCVVATWDVFGVGGFAELCLVQHRLACLKPGNISVVEGAAMANRFVLLR